ncbi:two-component system response regulator [Christensenella timonensis]|uniref:response regulator n=1 Tax=Christensenella timonensis TaxID=1816678 RepID=UPI000831D132|nr:HD domain-containing phosphohydrolase [Christensenella timonensis]
MANSILVVDDIEINRNMLKNLLVSEYDVLVADGGRQAIELLDGHRKEISMVLLDVIMPEVSGYDVLEYMGFHDMLRDIPVMLITAAGSDEMEEKGLSLGAVDYIRKPFAPDIVKRRARTLIELYKYQNHLEEAIEEKTEALSDINEMIVAVLTSVMETKTMETKEHIQRIRLYTKEILKYIYEYYDDNYGLTPQKIEMMGMASILHDVGELMLPESIVNNRESLSPEEEKIFMTHTTKGCKLIDPLKNLENEFYANYCYNICRYHHERWDGSGYPDKLSGNNIPICAQAVALAHHYDELMCKYGGCHDKALQTLMAGDAQQFSPVMTETLKLVGDHCRSIYENNKEKS